MAISLETYIYRSDQPGANLLVFGAVHGNEKCGTEAIELIRDELEKGEITIATGSVTLVPIVNKPAYDANIRCITENLNRIFKKTVAPENEEQKIANQACALIDKCDYLLDLHSFTASGVPFAFLDYPTPEDKRLVEACATSYVIENWPGMYGEKDGQIDSFDTQRYAHEQKKASVTLECGQHDDPNGKRVAYTSIIQTLQHLHIIDGDYKVSSDIQHIQMEEVYLGQGAGDSFPKVWKNFDVITEGEHIATYGDGTKVFAPFTGCMVMPNATQVKDDEFFYLGRFLQ